MCILGPPYCGIGATIRIGQGIRCLPYAGFFLSKSICMPFFSKIFVKGNGIRSMTYKIISKCWVVSVICIFFYEIIVVWNLNAFSLFDRGDICSIKRNIKLRAKRCIGIMLNVLKKQFINWHILKSIKSPVFCHTSLRNLFVGKKSFVRSK